MTVKIYEEVDARGKTARKREIRKMHKACRRRNKRARYHRRKVEELKQRIRELELKLDNAK